MNQRLTLTSGCGNCERNGDYCSASRGLTRLPPALAQWSMIDWNSTSRTVTISAMTNHATIFIRRLPAFTTLFGKTRFFVTGAFRTMAVPAIVFILWLPGCDNSANLPPAPLDSMSGLESLADAYKAEAAKLPASAMSLPPSARKKFVTAVFARANFSYAKTLQSFLQLKDRKITKNTKDLAQLLSLPHKGIDAQAKADLYSEQELAAVNQIDQVLTQ